MENRQEWRQRCGVSHHTTVMRTNRNLAREREGQGQAEIDKDPEQ
jgi:hypothetical protein